jgi:hypothetical protein
MTNINFDVKDSLYENFLSASRWQIDRPALTDGEIIKKSLKSQMGTLIETHQRFLALNIEEMTVQTFRQQAIQTQAQLMRAEMDLQEKKTTFESTFVPPDTA